jgi:acetylornithine deacetylase
MKGGIALIMLALARAAAQPNRGDIKAVLCPDEEHASLGARAFAASIAADSAIVVESTDLQLGIEHSGRIRAWIETPTRRHRDDLVQGLRTRCLLPDPHFIGLAWATVDVPIPMVVIQREVLPGDDAWRIHQDLAADVAALTCAKTTWDVRESFCSDRDSTIYATVARHTRNRGLPAESARLASWTEAAVFASAGLPSVVFGPGGGGTHTEAEWLDVVQTEQALEVLLEVGLDYCA